jgi:hypothetical protein
MRHGTKGFDSVWGLVPLHHVDCPCPSPCPRRDGISTCALVRLCISSPTTIVPGSLLLISPPSSPPLCLFVVFLCVFVRPDLVLFGASVSLLSGCFSFVPCYSCLVDAWLLLPRYLHALLRTDCQGTILELRYSALYCCHAQHVTPSLLHVRPVPALGSRANTEAQCNSGLRWPLMIFSLTC